MTTDNTQPPRRQGKVFSGIKSRFIRGQDAAMKRSRGRKSTPISHDKSGQLSTAPNLKRAINQHIKENHRINQSLQQQEGVTFKVRKGQLIAKNSKGEILYEGAKGEFKEYGDVTIKAQPGKRRLNEFLLDKNSLQEKKHMEGRSQPTLKVDKASQKSLEGTAENKKIANAAMTSFTYARSAKNVVAAPFKAAGSGLNKFVAWGRTPAGDSQGKSKERGR